MLQLVSLSWKNFLSYGNRKTEISFANGKPGLFAITGKSGSGKSAILDALFFALYGKPYRRITLDGLVNRTNGKNLSVRLKFKKDGDEYEVTRTRKPDSLSVKKNKAELADADQKTLDSVVGVSSSLFRRMAILSVSGSVPFMLMTAQEQRDYLTDIFALHDFSRMEKEEKRRMTDTKVRCTEAKTEVSTATTLLQNAKAMLASISNANTASVSADELNAVQAEIDELEKALDGIRAEIESLGEVDNETLVNLNAELSVLRSKAKGIVSEAKFFKSNAACPVCGRALDEEFREKKIAELRKTYAGIVSSGTEKKAEFDELKNRSDRKRWLEDEDRRVRYNVSNASTKKTMLESRSSTQTIDPTPYEQAVETNLSALTRAQGKLRVAEDEKRIRELCLGVLSDEGVKAWCMDKHLVFLNARANAVLEDLGLEIVVSVKGNREATLSQYGREIDYSSCSEGEKRKVDFALLWAFVKTAEEVSGWSCDTIFFDELLDSSIDDTSLSVLVGKVKDDAVKDGRKAFVVTHRMATMDVAFDGTYSVEKTDFFSELRGQDVA